MAKVERIDNPIPYIKRASRIFTLVEEEIAAVLELANLNAEDRAAVKVLEGKADDIKNSFARVVEHLKGLPPKDENEDTD